MVCVVHRLDTRAVARAPSSGSSSVSMMLCRGRSSLTDRTSHWWAGVLGGLIIRPYTLYCWWWLISDPIHTPPPPKIFAWWLCWQVINICKKLHFSTIAEILHFNIINMHVDIIHFASTGDISRQTSLKYMLNIQSSIDWLTDRWLLQCY